MIRALLKAFGMATLFSVALLLVFLGIAILLPSVFEVLLYPGMLIVSLLDDKWLSLGADRADAILNASTIELAVFWLGVFVIRLARLRWRAARGRV